MATQTLTITSIFQDITTLLSLTDATVYQFQNKSFNTPIILVKKTGDAPGASDVGITLYPQEIYSFMNSSVDKIYMRVPIEGDNSQLAVIE